MWTEGFPSAREMEEFSFHHLIQLGCEIPKSQNTKRNKSGQATRKIAIFSEGCWSRRIKVNDEWTKTSVFEGLAGAEIHSRAFCSVVVQCPSFGWKFSSIFSQDLAFLLYQSLSVGTTECHCGKMNKITKSPFFPGVANELVLSGGVEYKTEVIPESPKVDLWTVCMVSIVPSLFVSIP